MDAGIEAVAPFSASDQILVNTALTDRRFFQNWEITGVRVVGVVVAFGSSEICNIGAREHRKFNCFLNLSSFDYYLLGSDGEGIR